MIAIAKGACGRARGRFLYAAMVAAIVVIATGPLAAAELLMFERDGCVWCARWNSEIAPLYPKSAEGRAAPLRRIDVARSPGADAMLARPVRYTPTFVLIDRGREVGRITGYVNDASFWGLLGKMLNGIAEPGRGAAGLPPTME